MERAALGILFDDPLRTEPNLCFNPDIGKLQIGTEPGNCASIRRDLAKFIQLDDDLVEQNEFLDTLSRSKLRR